MALINFTSFRPDETTISSGSCLTSSTSGLTNNCGFGPKKNWVPNAVASAQKVDAMNEQKRAAETKKAKDKKLEYQHQINDPLSYQHNFHAFIKYLIYTLLFCAFRKEQVDRDYRFILPTLSRYIHGRGNLSRAKQIAQLLAENEPAAVTWRPSKMVQQAKRYLTPDLYRRYITVI